MGTISGPADSAAALLAVARGAGLAALISADPATYEHLFEDLSRLGPVAIRRSQTTGLSPTQEELLTQLAGGASLDEVATAMNYSRRTVERRLAEARAALGANTTAEALLRFRERSHRD